MAFRPGLRCGPEGRRRRCGDAGGPGQPGAGDPGHDPAPRQGGGDHPSQEEGQLHAAREGQSPPLSVSAPVSQRPCQSPPAGVPTPCLSALQALERFYEAVMQAILRHINFDGRAQPRTRPSSFFQVSHFSFPSRWFLVSCAARLLLWCFFCGFSLRYHDFRDCF